MYQLVRISDQDFIKPVWVKDFGTFNKMPEPFIECTKHDYFHQRSSYSPNFIEYRQVPFGDNWNLTSLWIEWFHNYAFAIKFPNKWRCGKNGEPHIVYEENCQYYRIGCQHKFVEIERPPTPRSGIHTEKCSLCGYKYSYDTSD